MRSTPSTRVVVVGTDWQVVTINDRACDQFDREKPTVLGASIDAVDPALRAASADGESRDLEVAGRIFEVGTTTVEDVRGRRPATALVVRDVTTQRGRKQRPHMSDSIQATVPLRPRRFQISERRMDWKLW